MLSLIVALSLATTSAEDLEEDLLPVVIGLVVIALVYAAVATWMVTAKDDPVGH
jgi:Na+/glutamate symporter